MSKLGEKLRDKALADRDPLGRTMLRRFCEVVERGEQPSQEALGDVAALLRGILDDPEADPKVRKALGLTGGRGRPRKTSLADTRREIEAAVRVLRKVEELRAAGAKNPEKQAMNGLQKTTQRHYERHKATAEVILALWDRVDMPAELLSDAQQRLEAERAEKDERRKEKEREKLYGGGLFD